MVDVDQLYKCAKENGELDLVMILVAIIGLISVITVTKLFNFW